MHQAAQLRERIADKSSKVELCEEFSMFVLQTWKQMQNAI